MLGIASQDSHVDDGEGRGSGDGFATIFPANLEAVHNVLHPDAGVLVLGLEYIKFISFLTTLYLNNSADFG